MVDFKELLKTPQYDFLKTNTHLGNNIILLGLGGSHAYGTNVEGSDVDIRGIALNSKEEILGSTNFEQVTNEATDTTIYSIKKIFQLLSNCNPNTIEILGCKPEHYLYVSPIGQELLDNKKLFLSKKAVQSFGGYATAQLRRLDNKSVRTVSQAEHEQHILNSIKSASYDWPEKYCSVCKNMNVKLYLDTTDRVLDGLTKDIFIDVDLKHYPLRDYEGLWSLMKNVVNSYDKLGQRNSKAIEHGKLGKHMMHLVRLYLMCLDILEKEEINTYREHDIPFLMDIRNGKYLDSNNHPVPEFYDLVDDYEKKLHYAAENTSLPDKPDYKKISDLLMNINERVVLGKV